MANLKEIRSRIASVNSTRQITSAMKMVSAAKLKRAQDTVTNFRPYAQKMKEILVHIASSLGQDRDNIYGEDRDYKQVLIVVITANRGLCGASNSNVIKESINLAETKYGDLMSEGKVRFMAIGKKGYDNLLKRGIPVDENHTEISEHLNYENTVPIAQWLIDNFTNGRYDCIDIVYNEFKNAVSQTVVCHQFLPLLPEEINHQIQHTDYIFEPSKDYIIKDLIPQNLKLVLYQALLDAVASEFGARMTSMQQATDNAIALVQELTLQYNKARQTSITNELMEIVSGAEALKG